MTVVKNKWVFYSLRAVMAAATWVMAGIMALGSMYAGTNGTTFMQAATPGEQAGAQMMMLGAVVLIVVAFFMFRREASWPLTIALGVVASGVAIFELVEGGSGTSIIWGVIYGVILVAAYKFSRT